jgi:hypothetical protein
MNLIKKTLKILFKHLIFNQLAVYLARTRV